MLFGVGRVESPALRMALSGTDGEPSYFLESEALSKAGFKRSEAMGSRGLAKSPRRERCAWSSAILSLRPALRALRTGAP